MSVNLTEVTSPRFHLTGHAGMITTGGFRRVTQGDLTVPCLLSKKRRQGYKTSDSEDKGQAALPPLFSVGFF